MLKKSYGFAKTINMESHDVAYHYIIFFFFFSKKKKKKNYTQTLHKEFSFYESKKKWRNLNKLKILYGNFKIKTSKFICVHLLFLHQLLFLICLMWDSYVKHGTNI